VRAFLDIFSPHFVSHVSCIIVLPVIIQPLAAI